MEVVRLENGHAIISGGFIHLYRNHFNADSGAETTAHFKLSMIEAKNLLEAYQTATGTEKKD